MPRRDGLSLLRALSDQLSELTFVMVTAQGSVEGAVAAMKDGAYDYLTKPIDPQRLRVLLEKLVERNDSKREVAALKREIVTDGRLDQIVGKSLAIRKVYQLVEQTAPTPASVLIYGESGTGKELVAAAVHKLSPRASSPFVAINCAAIPEGLLESEIFGHERGAFTGAVSQRQGCFELAHRGTLFLDEVAEMAPLLQAKLLRVLQERMVRRLGGSRTHPFDVRIVAATNAEPKAAVRDGRLRDDLYYRINVVEISLPPLRERAEDVPLLVQAFLPEFSRHRQRPLRSVTPDALRALERYTWPGNVRELRNVIERAVILSHGEQIEVADLPPDLGRFPDSPTPRNADTHRGDTGGSGRASLDRGDPRAHREQQDAGSRNARDQRQDVTQQAEQVQGGGRQMRLSLRARQVTVVTSLALFSIVLLAGVYLSSLVRLGLEENRARGELWRARSFIALASSSGRPRTRNWR